MAIDMNADLGEILRGFFSRNKSPGEPGTKQNPYTQIIFGGIGVFVVVLIYAVFVYLPKQEELDVSSDKINQIGQLTEEIDRLEAEVALEVETLAKSKAAYADMSKRFLSSGELDKLYRYISRLALTHKVLIAKLEQTDETPVFQADIEVPDIGIDGDLEGALELPPPPGEMMEEDSENSAKAVAYYRLLVQLNASGNFLKWSSFRRDLAKLEKIIIIEQENIKLVKSEKEKGRVEVVIVLAAFRWPLNEKEKYATPEGFEGVQ